MRGRKITVQTYSWKSRQENKVDNLLFDKPDVVTVLNTQSCKGLEFDAVFVVNLHEAQIGIYGPDRFKMQMFVAVSRARDWVSLLDSGLRAQTGTYYECLPGPKFLDREKITEAAKPRKLPSKPTSPPASAEASDWESELLKLAKKQGFSINDRRPKGGAVWVNGGNELARLLEPLGFAYSAKREGWWRN